MGNLATPGEGLALVPATHFSATVDLPTSGTLYIGTGGDLVAILADDPTDTFITFKNIPDGSDFPRRVKRINTAANGTTVTDVVLDK